MKMMRGLTLEDIIADDEVEDFPQEPDTNSGFGASTNGSSR